MANSHSGRPTLTMPRNSIDFAVGTAVGQYRISSLLREGSQATLFVVTDNTGKRLVMRVYFDGMAPDQGLSRRLMNTAGAHLCRILAIGEHGGHQYDVVPLLRDIPDIRMLSKEAQAALIKEEAEAIRAFHRLGYVHMDLKKEHFMATETGAVCLVDIGSAKRSGAPHPGDPSQFLPADAYTADARKETDLFSFGVALIEQYCPDWLAGKDRNAIIQALRDQAGIARMIGKLPESLRADVKALLSDNPEARRTCTWFSVRAPQGAAAQPPRQRIKKAEADLIMLCLKKELLIIASCCDPQIFTQKVQRTARAVDMGDPYAVLAFLNYLKAIPRSTQPRNYTNLTEESVLASLTANVVVSVGALSRNDPIRTLKKYQRQNVLYIYDKQLIREMDRDGAVIANKHNEIAWATLKIIGIIIGVIAAVAVAVAIIIALVYVLVILVCIGLVVAVLCAFLSS